jgi:hypothetical protein
MNNNRCLYCNEIIPEGRMVCPTCEHTQIKIGMILQSLKPTKEDIKMAYNFMEDNNDN